MLITVGSVVLELTLLFTPLLWRFKKFFATFLVLALNVLTAAVIVIRPDIVGIVVALVLIYRSVNLIRIIEQRMHEDYLKRSVRRTSFYLSLAQLGAAAIFELDNPVGAYLSGIMILELILVFVLFLSTIRNLYKTRYLENKEHYADRDLPTVSVAIPARNETRDLQDCLKSVLASDYPKLEILVLDDCSQEKTSEIIRGFAQDGVRFIKGEPPAERWLAKNQAYDRLADEATGELLLFCGVDVRFGPDAIRGLVTTLLHRDKQMISIVPKRHTASPLEALIQPLRYWWELAPPRRYFNRPAVLSTCWMIYRKSLQKLGGFEAVSHTIIPEGYFAREIVKTDGYSFLRANKLLDITTTKELKSQLETAVRMRYPQIRRRPEMALLITVILLFLLLTPFMLVISGLLGAGFENVHWLGFVITLILVANHGLIVAVTNPANWLVSVITFPLAVIIEVILGNYSMYKYEFSVVEWKGRNICIPVMHVIPRLPKA